MSVWWQLTIGIFFIWLLWRLFGWKIHKTKPNESVDKPPHGPFAGVAATKKHGPGSKSGAVALAEPDDDDEVRSYPPRTM